MGFFENIENWRLGLDKHQSTDKEVIKKQNFSSLKDMGTLMNNLKSEYGGSVDMAMAGKIAKLNLNN